MSNLTQFYQSGQGAYNTVRSYTASGTYTFVPPPGVTRVMALVFGAGGSGANLANIASQNRASGGCGGGFAQGLLSVTPGTSYTITVGAGGVAQSANSNGTAGGTSSFSTLLTATGGAGGVIATTGVAGSTVSGGSGSVSGAAVLWSFTASGGTQYNPSDTGTNATTTLAGGGSASGSPYGDGAMGNCLGQSNYGSGGSGWGPQGTSGGGRSINTFSNPLGISFASGGGGLRNSGPGYAAGGGGAFNASNWGGASAGEYVNINGYNIASISYNAGGGPNGWGPITSAYLYQPAGTSTSPIPNQFVTSPPTHSDSANFFDIVNTTLSGSGGFGAVYNLPQTNVTGLHAAGNGEGGGGGGGLYTGSFGSTGNQLKALAGNGGIGGGGGGCYQQSYASNYFYSGIGGVGGFGGGGGGSASAQTASSTQTFGGAGGIAGGGGAAQPGNTTYNNFYRSGPGGDGAVLIFWRAT